MPNQYESDVVRFFRRKGASGFTEPITFLGAEQRFVNSLRNSGTNNLEEQYILGTDTYTEVYTDEHENIIVEKSFHINSNDTPSNYYKVKTTVYKEGTEPGRDFYFSGNQLLIPDNINKIIFGNGTIQYPDLDTLYGVDNSIFNFNDDEFLIYLSDYITVRTDELFFIINNGATVKPVLTKTIYKKYEKDENDNVKIIYKEDITNHLISS